MHPKDIPVPTSRIGPASYRHAFKLNELKKYCNTRFVCFIDPDFFVFTPINDIINSMKNNGYVFYGAPYYPIKGRKKIYDFPVAFCMFIDLEHVTLNNLDFTPVGELPDGTMGDTGYSVYKNHLNYPNYCVLPSFPGKIEFARTTGKSLISLGIKPSFNIDEYFHEDGRLFGLHLHAKLHLQTTELDKQKKIFQHINEIKRIYDKIIQCGNV